MSTQAWNWTRAARSTPCVTVLPQHEAFALGELTGGKCTGRQALVVVCRWLSHINPHTLHVGTVQLCPSQQQVEGLKGENVDLEWPNPVSALGSAE